MFLLLCPNIQTDWMDKFKVDFANELINTLIVLSSNLKMLFKPFTEIIITCQQKLIFQLQTRILLNRLRLFLGFQRKLCGKEAMFLCHGCFSAV
jgi:hypothetical protein